MNVVALCKTFQGYEWVKPMALSILPRVDKIVFVNSEISWTGRRGNNCKAEIAKLPPEKIICLNFDTQNQIDQVAHGYKYIQDNLSCDYVMLIDTDEVWGRVDLVRAFDFLKKNSGYKAYKAAMYTYIKSPYWRVDPPEPLNPVVFIPSNFSSLELYGMGERGHNIKNNITIIDEKKQKAFFHHFIYVREKFNTILEKIMSSHASEGTEYIDMRIWIPEVWNKLPDARNFHPSIGFAKNWKRLIQVKQQDLPEILQEEFFFITEMWK